MSKWEEAYYKEINSLKNMSIYKLILHTAVPPGHKVQKGQPVFKIKRNERGKAVRYKVHLVFKGYEQIYSKNYNKTTSLTAHMES